MRERTEASRVRQPTPRGEDGNASGVGAASFRVSENLHALEVLEESLQRGRATCAAFNRQGTLLAAGTAAGVVEIWDFETRAVARELYDARATMTSGRETDALDASTTAAVLSVHWSNDGKKLISSCADGSVSVWDVRENDVVFKAVFDAPLHDARFSPLNPRVALAAPSDDGPMTFALTRGRRRAPLPTMPGDIDVPSLVCRIPSAGVLGNTTPGHAVFSKTGKHAFVAGARGVVTVVETATADIVQACKVPDAALIKRLELSNCGKHMLVLSNGRTVASYDVDETANDERANGDDESRKQQTTEAPVVNAFALGADDDDDDEDATMMDGVDDPSDKANDQRQRQRKGVLTPSRVFANAASRGQWSAAAFSHDAKFVAAASSGGAHELHVWERESGSLCRVAVGAEASKGVAQIVPHPTRAVFVVLGSNGVMYVWSRAFAEKWSAFEPGFVELDDNEEYVEREDEFDVAERKRPLSDPSGSVAKALANRELVARGAAVEAAARVTEAELAVRRELEAMEKGEAAEAEEERRKAELEAAKPEGAEGATSEGGARQPTRLDVKTETALIALVDASAPVALVSGADANDENGAGSKSAVRAVDQSAALELAATLRGARSEAAAAAAAAAETASLMKSSDLMLAATQAKAREEARDAAERAATLGMTSSELDPELVDVDVWTSPRGFFSDEEEDAADVMRHLPMDLGPDPEATLVIETRTTRWRERERRTLEEEKTVGEGDGTVDCPSGAEKDEKSARDEEQVFAAEKTSSAGDKRKRATSDE